MDEDLQENSNREEAPGARVYGQRRRGRRPGSGPREGNGDTPRPAPQRDQAVPEPEEVKPARELLEQILERMGIESAEVAYIPRTEGEYLEVRGADLANLIGRHGNTLEALNLVFNNIINAGVRNARHYYTIDAEGYRARRADQLKTIALQTLERTIREKRPIKLEPMLPSERKIIHLVLADSQHVRTESEGEEPERRVVIHPR